MTSGGTDVIEMSASTSRSTTGAAVDVIVGDGVSLEVGIVERGGGDRGRRVDGSNRSNR